MRHLLSVLVGLVLAPLVYISAGFAAVWFTEATSTDNTDTVKALLGLGAAAIAGAFYAILLLTRLSPVGPVVVGLAYLGVGAWSVVDQDGFNSSVAGTLIGVNGVLHAAVPFGTSLLAVPLLITVFSPRRWRHTERPEGYDGGIVYPPSPASAAPTYSPVGTSPTFTPIRPYEPINDDETPTARDAPSLASLTGFQPPQYTTNAPSFPGFIPRPTGSTGDDDDQGRPRFG
jgi:hypothetical protein